MASDKSVDELLAEIRRMEAEEKKMGTMSRKERIKHRAKKATEKKAKKEKPTKKEKKKKYGDLKSALDPSKRRQMRLIDD